MAADRALLESPPPAPVVEIKSIVEICEAELALKPDALRAARLHFELGREATDKYAQFRRELLIVLTQSISTENSLSDVARVLNLMAGMYDQAACVAAAHRIST